MRRSPTGRPATRRLAALLAVTAAALLAPAASYASGVTVADLDHSVTPTQLASALTGGGVAVSNVTYTGANRAAGSFTGGAGNVGFANGIVLDSGKVQTYPGDTGDPLCEQGVEGPNNCYETSGPDGGSNSNSMGTAGDSDLDTLSGELTEDASILQFDFVPQQSTVEFSYVFSSEEYNDYANTSFNDVFGFFVNGTNCAVVPNTNPAEPVSVNTINNGNPGGDTTAHHPELFNDNVRPNPTIDSQMDGLTDVLTCHANVNAGVTNHMKLAIADASDDALDSAVFIQAGSLISGRVLTVSKNGTGTGTVTSSPAGINCGATCSNSYTDGTMVTLTATADATSTFTGWSGGGCTGTGTCIVTMDAAKSVTATFTLVTHTLTVTKDGTGTGTVTSSPAGIDCGVTCDHDFAHTTMVTLTPTADIGSAFAEWTGACTGSGGCTVTMDAAKSVKATFNTAPPHNLDVAKNGSGSGSVSSAPAGIDCGATCTHSYAHGTVVTLTATAASGSNFAGWSGSGCSGTGTCSVTIDAAKSVTATFTLQTHALTVSKAGTGTGSVTSSPAGINCGATCSASYDHGTSVTLTATAAAGSSFAGWSGDCSGTGSCVVAMNGDHAVTATFTASVTPPVLPPPVIGGPPSVGASDLFCGAQHRGKCRGLKVKGVFDRPGNASWTFAAYNPTPGGGGQAAAAGKKLRLGQIKRVITKAGTVTVVFKLKKGAKTNKLYKQVKKAKLKSILVTLTFTTPSGEKKSSTKTIKLKK